MRFLSSILFPIHPEGFRFIFIFGAITLLLFWLAGDAGWFGVGVVLACAIFFRDPDRYVPQRDGLVVSPADGVVQMISDAVPPKELGLGAEMRPRISIYLSLFDCHINRSPCRGMVTQITYRPGRFVSADLDKASEANERNALLLELPDGRDLVVIQIAGLVARRIICFAQEDQELDIGERFGLIRFGSRVDVYLPSGVIPQVAIGQACVAGETILADFEGTQDEWEAERV